MASAATKLLGRGVWYADYLVRGRPVLLAITSFGECIRRVRLATDDEEDVAREWLDGLLEHYDPPVRRHLTLVSSEPPRRPRGFFLPLLKH